MEYLSAGEAVQLIESGNRVFIHGGASTPLPLIQALLNRAGELRNVELVAISLHGGIEWDKPAVRESFYLNSLFVSDNIRQWVASDSGDYVPVFLSEIPNLFRSGALPLDVALIQVSEPDRHGYCTLGTSVDVAMSAVQCAKKIIALVNPRMPRVHGDGAIHVSRIDAMHWQESELPQISFAQKVAAECSEIGRQIAGLVEDGATLQLGIGSIPDAVLQYLGNHKNLGLHTEMFSDGVIPLIQSGVINNERKAVVRGRSVTSFILGTNRLYEFVNDNPSIACLNVGFVNDTAVIRRNPKVVAVNSAIEVDLTGQVCADSIGTLQYSGIGGQMDFIRGAGLSEGGKPIIALPSTTKNGTSRIVPCLREGAGVVTTRGHIHYVVTEYGVVNLYGKNLQQRADLLTSIAHPAHRESLERACRARFGQKIYHF